VLFNAACLESLKNNTTTSLLYLKKSIDLDPSLLISIKEEKDLNNVRNSKEFKELFEM
jgi:hypothetical protein